MTEPADLKDPKQAAAVWPGGTSTRAERQRRPHSDAAAFAWAARLAADLQSPPAKTTVAGLAAAWLIEHVRATCRRPKDFFDYPELSVRVRGAFGRALAALPARVIGGWSLPSPFSVLFASAGRWRAGLEIPKPLVVRSWIDHDTLITEVSLFGMAGVFIDDAEVALVACLEKGISIGPESRHRVPLSILDVSRSRVDGLELPGRALAASLTFRTPVAVRTGRSLVLDAGAIARSTMLRVSGMARWQGVELGAGWQQLHRSANGIVVDDRKLIPAHWNRYSLRRGENAIPVSGWLGTLMLSGRLGEIAPYLRLAETCNTGSHASLGLGWYDLVMV